MVGHGPPVRSGVFRFGLTRSIASRRFRTIANETRDAVHMQFTRVGTWLPVQQGNRQGDFGLKSFPTLLSSVRIKCHTRTQSHMKQDTTDDDFDWGLCLSLAGCAFEAYNDLDGDDKHLVRKTRNGTEVSFVDLDFVQSRYEGILEFHLKRADDLPQMNWIPGTKSDPFCSVTVDGAEFISSTRWGTLNPEWNEKTVFFVRSKRNTRVNCRVVDDAVVGTESLMGSAIFPSLEGLQDQEEEEFTIGIGKGKGSVTFSLKYTPFEENKQAQDAAVGSMGGPVVGSLPKAIMESPWRALRQALISAENAANLEFNPVAFIENPDLDSQAWIFWNQDTQRLVVAFRGTEQTQWKDLMTDANLFPTKIEYDEGTMRLSSDATPEGNDVWVHTGFLKAYVCIQKEVADVVNQIVGQGSWDCFITGHSLGGALSTLCAYDLGMQGKVGSIVCYNYGSPMVGSQAFTESFNKLIPHCWRIVNENDAVCQVPRMIGYSHAGRKVLLRKDGAVEFAGVEDMDVGEDTNVAKVVKKLSLSTMMSLASQVKALGTLESLVEDDEDVDIEGIIQSEVNAMQTLLDGSGIDEHMEETYLGTIESAIRATLKNIKNSKELSN